MPAPFNIWISLTDEEPDKDYKRLIYGSLTRNGGEILNMGINPCRLDTHWMKLRPPTRQELADEQVRQAAKRHRRIAGLRTDTQEGKNQT